MRCYAWRVMEALLVGLLLAAVAGAWSQGHLELWPRRAPDSTVSSPAAPDHLCPDAGLDALMVDRHGGAVVTAC